MKLSQLAVLFQNSTSLSIAQESVSHEFEDILDYLNKVTGHKFESSTRSYRLLWAKLKAYGYTFNDAKLVIDYKVKDFADWSKRKNYLHPITLFDLANFKRYLVKSLCKSNNNKNINS